MDALPAEHATKIRPMALDIGADHPDILFAITWILRGMKGTMVQHDRLAAYLATPEVGMGVCVCAWARDSEH